MKKALVSIWYLMDFVGIIISFHYWYLKLCWTRSLQFFFLYVFLCVYFYFLLLHSALILTMQRKNYLPAFRKNKILNPTYSDSTAKCSCHKRVWCVFVCMAFMPSSLWQPCIHLNCVLHNHHRLKSLHLWNSSSMNKRRKRCGEGQIATRKQETERERERR